MSDRPVLVVFLGGLGNGQAESIVGTARWAASLDTIEAAMGAGVFDGAVLVTDGETPPPDIPGVELDTDDGSPFHFGRRLASVIRRHDPSGVVYMGGGSLPLLPASAFAAVAECIGRGVAVTNNAYSSDVVGIPLGYPVQGGTEPIAAAIETVGRDNALARALSEKAGLSVTSLERTIETQFDIDSPTDLTVLSVARAGGPRLRAYLDALEPDTSRYQLLLPVFMDTEAQLLVAGRVSSQAWAYLERETACRVRLLAEERGMEAEGRAEAGKARSLLGFYLETAGLGRFFEALAELCDAAIIDTRVLLAHKRADASREDRFLSDLGRWREIGDSFLRDFTRAALEAPVPVLLGGHSLVSGGLMLLSEHAWSERDAGRL